MSKKVSMDDIARKIGVSKNTVSLALRGMPGISKETHKLIVDTAQKMGYVYKNSAGNKQMVNETRNICLILSQSLRNTEFYSYIQMGIEAEARKDNLNTIIYYYDEKAQELETPLCVKEGMVSGIITLGSVKRKTLESIICYNLPLVLIDQYFDNISIDYILTDNISASFLATEYLIKCSHSKIGFCGNIHSASSFYDRYEGYLKAMGHYGLSIDSSWCITDSALQKMAGSDMAQMADRLRASKNLPTAFFCCNDSEATALYRVLDIMGLKVPDDISIVGFDNIEFSQKLSPELSTMHIEKELMGIKAVQRLVEKMEDRKSIPQKTLISTRLVQRQSVKKL